MRAIVIGLFCIALGIAFLRYNRRCEENFGRVRRAELNLGGTHVLYALIGVGCIVIGILFLFGFGGSNPTNLEGVGLT